MSNLVLSKIALKVKNLTKVYGAGETRVVALDDISLEIDAGTFCAIMGPSGSGKTTLLQIMAGLDKPTSGEIFIGDEEVTSMNEAQLTELRRKRIGFIFQTNNLLPTLTAKENILLPLIIAGSKPDEEWFERVISAVGLGNRLEHRPSELSQGQQQRVATARALITQPRVVLADEPTGNLDSRSSNDLLEFLSETMGEFSQTIIMVTHDQHAATWARRVIEISDGRVRQGAQASP
jgi:putative ABC transport system ATP-binding protein